MFKLSSLIKKKNSVILRGYIFQIVLCELIAIEKLYNQIQISKYILIVPKHESRLLIENPLQRLGATGATEVSLTFA